MKWYGCFGYLNGVHNHPIHDGPGEALVDSRKLLGGRGIYMFCADKEGGNNE